MNKTYRSFPPLLILGGAENTLSIVRSFGKKGIKVIVSTQQEKHVVYSKYLSLSLPYDVKKNAQKYWHKILLNDKNEALKGCIIFTCEDDAIEFVSNNHAELKNDYILDDSYPDLNLKLLDKLETLNLATKADIKIPKFWLPNKKTSIEQIKKDISYPAILKPVHSHLFQRIFEKKYFLAENNQDLINYSNLLQNKNIEFFIVEKIPGPDSLLSSYYTYIDQNGNNLFHYTKKVIRRYPTNEGLGCYHKSEWSEEISELGQKFFSGINFKGFGNIEFKRDLRDGELKVIECNPRFTSAQELLVRSGIDVAWMIYNHLIGEPVEKIVEYDQNLRFWFPVRDFFAYQELKRRGEITFFGWLRSLMHRQCFPFFKLSDPFPTLRVFFNSSKNKIKKIFRK